MVVYWGKEKKKAWKINSPLLLLFSLSLRLLLDFLSFLPHNPATELKNQGLLEHY